MIASIALMLLGTAAAATTPCENLTTLKLPGTTFTSATVVPEGPAPARPGRGGSAEATPANIPAHCRVQTALKTTSDSLINMELWLPAKYWKAKLMVVGYGVFAGWI